MVSLVIYLATTLEAMRKRKREKKYLGHSDSNQSSPGLPDNIKKDRFIYQKGVITKVAHGTYKVNLESGIETINTARRLDTFLKISLIEGDIVYVEIDPLNLTPGEVVRGRIVYREKSIARK